jgi:hypothetical protein
MINYVKEKSPFYTSHELFCQKVERYADVKSGTKNGFCNSFDYEVSITFEEND